VAGPGTGRPDQRRALDPVLGGRLLAPGMYSTSGNLFGWEEKSGDNETIARAFHTRLKEAAGFRHVPEPLPMRNSKGNVLYYLFFASLNPTGGKIVNDILKKYR